MIAARLPRFSAAPENSAHPSASNGVATAGTGVIATRRRTRSGAASRTCWMACPVIECPTRENRSHPSWSASASASAAASRMVNSPVSPLRLPYPRRSMNAQV